MNSIHPLSWRVFDFLQKQEKLKIEGNYLIAVSGGCDSVALARVFFEIKKKKYINVALVYLNHNLRTNSQKECLFVEKLAKKWGFGYWYFENKQLQKPDIQNKARQWRYKKLEKLRVVENFDFIVLAHHLDDLVETQIWRLMRGVSLFDCVGMLPVQGYFLRPLIYTSKLEIKNYLVECHQEWMEDESNFSEDYTRNYIRLQIIPKMKAVFLKEGRTSNNFLYKMLALHQEVRSLNKMYLAEVPRLQGVGKLHYKQVQLLPELFGKKLLYDFFLTYQMQGLFRAQVNKAYQLVMQNKGGWRLQMGKEYICFGREKKIFCQKKIKN